MATETKRNATETEAETVTETELNRPGMEESEESEYEAEDRIEGKGVILTLHAKRFPGTDGKSVHLQIASADVWRHGQDVLRAKDGLGSKGYFLCIRHSVHCKEV